MKKIASFQVDHTKIAKGMYISRIYNDIITYDIRMIKPNNPPYLENDGIHSFEHLFATYVRSSNFSENIIYVGPMGCRTGFYLIVKNLSPLDAISLTRKAMAYISCFKGNLPGNSAEECGNYLEHNVERARAYAMDMLITLKHWKVENLNYQI